LALFFIAATNADDTPGVGAERWSNPFLPFNPIKIIIRLNGRPLEKQVKPPHPSPLPRKREAVKKFNCPAKSAFPVVQGTEKFAPAKSGGHE